MKRVVILMVLALLSPGNLLTDAAENFGKKHFIVGYPHTQSAKQAESIQPIVSNAPNNPCWKFGCPGKICQAFFSPHDDLKTILLDLIAQEKKSIQVAIYMFTDKELAQALIDAKKRTIDIQVVADGGCLKDRYSKIPQLQKEGIAVYLYQPKDQESMLSDILHHKFVIFGKNINDKTIVWTGSFNFTKSANARNQENVVVLDDASIVQQFKNQFERLKKQIMATTQVLQAKGGQFALADLGKKATRYGKRALRSIKII